MSESLNKRLGYLGLADFNYLSARYLLISGIATTGLRLSAESFELLFKLFLLLANKIQNNRELTSKDLKKFEHKLHKTFSEVKKFIPVTFNSDWDNYFIMLESAYRNRYPEAWKEAILINDVSMLDQAYCYFRNGTVMNFPKEESTKAKVFGTFIISGYSDEIKKIIRDMGGKTPMEILGLNNKMSNSFDIVWDNNL